MLQLDLTSEQTIRDLAYGRIKWPSGPWKRGRPEGFYKTVCRQLCHDLRIQSKIQWYPYEQGYASFIDAWFYKDTPEFRVHNSRGKQEFTGLWVLLQRWSPYYVIGQGEKSWGNRTSSTYAPDLNNVDNISSEAVLRLSGRVDRRLKKHGFVRLNKKVVSRRIPQDICIETILSHGDLRLFDALFNWMD